MAYKDITGQEFGWLTAVEKIGTLRRGAVWRCRCRCGAEVEALYECLRKGSKVSCGCKTKAKAVDPASMVGKTYGYLTVLDVSDHLKYKQRAVRCRCVCGKVVDAIPRFLRDGRVISCGCVPHKNWKEQS